MNYTVKLTAEEKTQMCVNMAQHLPAIRRILGVTQEEFGDLCGFSRIRVSHIENGKEIMSWSQLTSVMFVCFVNANAKEYVLSNRLLSLRFMQFMQLKSDGEAPDRGGFSIM